MGQTFCVTVDGVVPVSPGGFAVGRKRTRTAVLTAVVAGMFALTASGASAQSCTGQLVRVTAPATTPFGANIVAPTAQTVDNFGRQVIAPEATAPHDDCP
jgi:hypothetical protein